jgi:hypothetical protein
MKKRGNILTENIIFLVLNLIFLSIMLVFVVSQTGSTAVAREKYSKQIALMLDSAQPGMIITFNMKEAYEIAEKENYGGDILSISGNKVHVKLNGDERNEGGTYYFFNDISVRAEPIKTKQSYLFVISEGEN